MATATTRPTVRRSRAGLILILSPLAFAVVVITLLTASSGSGAEDAADITPAIMAEIGPSWIGLWIIFALAVTFGSTGMFLLFRSRPAALARAAVAATVLSVVCTVVQAGLKISLVDFSADRLGSMTQYNVALEVSLVSFWLGFAAVVCGGLALRRSGELPRTGLVVAVVAALLGIVDIAGHGVVPPFVLSFLWLAIGIGVLKARGVPSGA